MAVELDALVIWCPPEDLRKDCATWFERCKLCISIHGRPRDEASFAAVSACKPFYRLQMDLMEVKPTGLGNERYVFTFICVATRYVFFRPCTNRESTYLATVMLDVILDCGVVPAVVQSDNEYVS